MNRFRPHSRLLLPSDYHAVFNGNPLSVSDRHFRLLAVTQTGANDTAGQPCSSTSRLGLAIAKKQVRKASQRSRIKRQAREVFRNFGALQQAKLCSNDGNPPPVRLDIVVLARPAAAIADKAELRGSLQRLLQQLVEISQCSGAKRKGPLTEGQSRPAGNAQK